MLLAGQGLYHCNYTDEATYPSLRYHRESFPYLYLSHRLKISDINLQQTNMPLTSWKPVPYEKEGRRKKDGILFNLHLDILTHTWPCFFFNWNFFGRFWGYDISMSENKSRRGKWSSFALSVMISFQLGSVRPWGLPLAPSYSKRNTKCPARDNAAGWLIFHPEFAECWFSQTQRELADDG